MNKPLVSIVLGSYNRLPYLQLTIDSMRQEATHLKHEIIVVDGGSDDGSLAWLIEQKDIITYVQHNRGQWQGQPIKRRSWGYFMNLGFKGAQGKYICMVSDDCILVPGSLKKGLDLFEQARAQGRNIGAVAFYFREWSKEEEYHVGLSLGNKMYVNHGLYLNAALQDVGYIDEETFFFYNADEDLCLKLWHKGYEVIDSLQSFVEHYPHANITVRSTNYERSKKDLNSLLKKWTGIYYDPLLNNRGMRLEVVFNDATKTGERFLCLHEQVVREHPHVLKKESVLKKILKQLRWKYQAAVRKIKCLLILIKKKTKKE